MTSRVMKATSLEQGSSAVAHPVLATPYPLLDHHGELVATKVRTDYSDGSKDYVWLADGSLGLGGRSVTSLPLYGAQHANDWDVEYPVWVVEGEKVADALMQHKVQAAGIVTGASATPDHESLMVLISRQVILCPDNDEGGRGLMQRVAQRLADVAAEVLWLEPPDTAPKGWDVADALAAADHPHRVLGVLWAERVGPLPVVAATPQRAAPRPSAGPRSRSSRIERFNAHYGVAGLLQRCHGLHAVPGRSVRCPWHDDRHPSLSVLADDRRVYCHSPSCWAHNGGQGRDAWDIAGQSDEVLS